MAISSILKPENSIIAGVATMAIVFALYQQGVGPVSMVHATPANDTNIQASLKKTGYTALIAVAGVSLLARDANIAILGGASIVAEELQYRHAAMASPLNGRIDVTPADYQAAGSSYQADTQQTAYGQ